MQHGGAIGEEEEEFLNDMLNLFPTFQEDFDENSKSNGSNRQKTDKTFFNENHLIQVSKLHMVLVKASINTKWDLNNNNNFSMNPDFISPLCMR